MRSSPSVQRTLSRPRARAVTRFLFARPPPGIGDTQGAAFRRYDIGGMQVQAARGLVGERTKAGNTLPLEVQFGAVLPAKDDRVLPPPGFSLGDVRIEDVSPPRERLSSRA